MSGSIRIMDMPDLGAVSDAVSLVAEHAGSGRVTAPAMRSYMSGTFLSLSGGALTGPLTSSQPGVFDNTAMHIGSQFELNGLDPAAVYNLTHAGKFATIGLHAGVAVPAGTAYEADAFAAYITNSSTTTGAAAGSFYALNLVAGAVSWALNPLVDDQGHVSTVMALECDVGASNVGSSAYGCNMIGVFPSGTPATAIAYQVSTLNAPWQWSLVSYDGASINFAEVGAKATTANSDGQLLQFNARDAANTVRSMSVQAVHKAAGADLYFSTPAGGVLMSGYLTVTGAITTTATANLQLGATVSASGGNLVAFYSGATLVGSITTTGTATSYNTSSDYRLKDVFGPADTGALIDAIPAYDAAFKGSEQHQPMLLAHEIAEGGAVWAVNGEKDAVDDAGAMLPQMVDYLSLIPAIWAELRALRLRVAALEAA